MVDAEGSGVGRRRTGRTQHKLLKWAGIVSACVLLALTGLTIYRYPFVKEKQKSDAAVAYIQSQHLTMADVDGSHLPPPPDPAQVDATAAGVDANGNGIRDDVELAIFAKYPNDSKIRAAALQYAVAQQWFLTEVTNEQTWSIADSEVSRAVMCVKSVADSVDAGLSLARGIEALVFDTKERAIARTKAMSFITSSGVAAGAACDDDSE